jgi:hypothetical protein
VVIAGQLLQHPYDDRLGVDAEVVAEAVRVSDRPNPSVPSEAQGPGTKGAIWSGTTGPSTRLLAGRFLGWIIRARLVRPDLQIRRHSRGTSPRMSAIDQAHAVQRVVHTADLSPRDRAAAILVLIFGQQTEDIVGLTWDDVDVTDDDVTVRVEAIKIELPDQLDKPWRQLATNPGNELTATHPNSNWVFRGYSPGRHITPVTSATNYVRSSAHPPRGSAGCANSPNLLPLRSWRRPSITVPPPSNATPSTLPPPTADTSQPSPATETTQPGQEHLSVQGHDFTMKAPG